MDIVNILIIGGGVVGCAIARAASERWPDVFLVEQFPRLGMGTSTRNSGVIHSGIYYPQGSAKARHCVEGNALTLEFCRRHNVAHRRSGKLVVATNSAEETELQSLAKLGAGNGVLGLRMISAQEIKSREPHVNGVAALEVPSTGIVSAEELVHAYARVALDRGANLITRAKLISLESAGESIRAELRIGDAEVAVKETVEARCVINAAGLYADDVASMLGPRPWKIFPVRGEYCEVHGQRASLINNLVYPLPHSDGLSLGVHLTKTLWGTLLVGPTANYVNDKENYERNRLGVSEFARDAKKLLPEISEADLRLGYSGLRAKLLPPGGTGMADFVITPDPSVPRVIHLLGIDSPGLTAAPSIASEVTGMIAAVLEN